ncbi:COX15/CtaA family protein [Georgenia sp. Z1344]|uniref:COX15/CtaA family protein n=1 Tax=Georgenia sp. Z1344 TaxID=3416706 RepID=UPI003CF8DF77
MSAAPPTDQAPTSQHGGGGPVRPSRRDLVSPLTWWVAVANLVCQIGIIVTGGLVRVTGSGLGCSTWPMCEPGQFTPVFHEETSYHAFIEFGNRTLTGVLGVVALALVVLVWRTEPTRRRPDRLHALALAPLAGVILQAVIGGITVLLDLHPAVVGLHMYVSLGLVAFSTYLLVRLASPDTEPRPLLDARTRTFVVVLVALAAVMTVLGTIVTGAGPHSGDDTHPYRWALDPLAITRAHAWTVYAFTAVLVVVLLLLLRRRRAQPALGRAVTAAWTLVGLTVAGAVTGIVQHNMGLPGGLVILHMLIAALVVGATTWLWASTVDRWASTGDLDLGTPSSVPSNGR